MLEWMSSDAALADYLAIVCAPTFDLERARQAASALLREALAGSAAERERALGSLADDIARDAPSLTLSATVAGALVEHGASVERVARVLLPRLEAWIDAAARSLEHALADRPPDLSVTADDVEDDAEDAEARWVDERLANDPAWRMLHEVYLPCIAVFGRSAEARHSRAALVPTLQRLEPYHGGAAWLRQMLAVLDDEALVVIDVASRKGFSCVMSGVATNFELFVLLAGALSGDPGEGWLDVPRPPSEVLRCLSGDGPQQTELTVECPWNAYAFTALAPNLELPEADDYGSSQHWVWGEGEPWEIPMLGDTRVILLGPPSYVRLIPAQRTFATLKASVEATRMTDEQTAEWLARIARAGTN
jgi:hypothetical protein